MMDKAVFSNVADGLCQIEDCTVVEIIADVPHELIEAGVSQGTCESISGAGLPCAAETEELPCVAGIAWVGDQDRAGVP